MKKIFSALLLLAFVFNAAAQTKPTPKTKTKFTPPVIKPAFKNLMDSFSYAIGYNIASNIKSQGIKKINLDLVKKAMDEAYKNKPAAITTDLMNTVMQRQMEAFQAETAQQEIARGRAFLESNKKRQGITVLPSGLQYEVLVKADTGTAHPKDIDTVVVHYIGTLIDGKEFENSYKEGTPATFTVNRVIQGWTEALKLMTPGEKWKVYIPTELAYYLYPRDPRVIPPGAALIFEIELMAIKPKQQ